MLRRYFPHIMQDCSEPFPLSAIGVQVFDKSGMSSSFRRYIEVPPFAKVIEYQLFWVYDIQHLYDLEHIWVTVLDDKVIKIEASFHGKYINISSLAKRHEDGSAILYCQPGKHAFLPEGRLFQLYPDPDGCCLNNAGSDGFLVMDLFSSQFSTDEKRSSIVKDYIKKHYAFKPTWTWQEMDTSSVAMMEWEELKKFIVKKIKSELVKIEESNI